MPINNISDVGFGNPLSIPADEMAALAAKIASNFE
jgi:hypothetical protein